MYPTFQPTRSRATEATVVTEAVQSLVSSLGYKKREAEKIVQETIEKHGLQSRIDADIQSLDELITLVLVPTAKPTSVEPLPGAVNTQPETLPPGSLASPDLVSSSPVAADASPEEILGHLIRGGMDVDQAMSLVDMVENDAKIHGPPSKHVNDDITAVPPSKSQIESLRNPPPKVNPPTVNASVDDVPRWGAQFTPPQEVAPLPVAPSESVQPAPPEPESTPVIQPAPIVTQTESRPSNPPSEEPARQESAPRTVPNGWFTRKRDVEPAQSQPVEQSRPAAPTQSQPAPAADGTSVSASIQNQFVTESQSPSTQQPAQVVEQSQASAQPAPPTESELIVDTGLDAVQTGLDAAGVVDPTPVSDGANAVISLGRAASDPKNAGTHLLNAGISVVSMIPYIGDIAKAAKYGGKAAKGANAASAAKSAKMTNAEKAASVENSVGKAPSEQFEEIWNRVSGGAGGPINNGLGGSGSGGSGGSGSGGAPPSGGDDDPNGSTPGSSEPVADANVKPITDKALELAGVFGTIVGVGLTYAKTTEQLNRVALEYHRNIAGFNGELSKAYGDLETGRMRRDMQNAQDYGGSVAGLANSQNELEEALQDFQSPFTEMGTDIQNGLTQLATLAVQAIDFLGPLSELYPEIKRWLGFKEGSDPKAPGGYFDRLRQKADQFKQKDKL